MYIKGEEYVFLIGYIYYCWIIFLNYEYFLFFENYRVCSFVKCFINYVMNLWVVLKLVLLKINKSERLYFM